MKKILDISIILFLINLVGCEKNNYKFVKAMPPGNEKGLVYIYRLNSFCSNNLDYNYKIKYKNIIVELPKSTYSYFYIPSGIFKIRATIRDVTEQYIDLKINKNETKFLEINPCPNELPNLKIKLYFKLKKMV